jgi:hypothetical protein
MVLVRLNSIALLSVLCANDAVAFTARPIALAVPLRRSAVSPRYMAEGEPEDGTFVKSVLKKEIAYDEKAGRFFETNVGEGECIPAEEFCYLDKESGENIRLTIEEKERIFLDSLQVRQSCTFCCKSALFQTRHARF